MLKSFKIGPRLGLSFGLVIALLAGVGYLGWSTSRSLAAESTEMFEKNLRPATLLASAERGLWELRFQLPNYLLAGPEDRRKITAKGPEWRAQVEQNIAGLKALDLASNREGLAAFEKDFATYLSARPRYFELIDLGQVDEAKEFQARETNPAAARAVAALGKLIEIQEQDGKAGEAAVQVQAERSTRLLVILVLLAVGLAAVLSWQLTRSVTVPAKALSEQMQILAGGDLTRRIEVISQDEVGDVARHFNGFAGEVARILGEVQAAIEALSAAAGQVASSAQNVSQGTSEQARFGGGDHRQPRRDDAPRSPPTPTTAGRWS